MPREAQVTIAFLPHISKRVTVGPPTRLAAATRTGSPGARSHQEQYEQQARQPTGAWPAPPRSPRRSAPGRTWPAPRPAGGSRRTPAPARATACPTPPRRRVRRHRPGAAAGATGTAPPPPAPSPPPTPVRCRTAPPPPPPPAPPPPPTPPPPP